MSIKIMSLVFDSQLERDKRFILLALADHADHDGRNCYPSVATLARKTGYSERQVQRALNQLAKDRIIIRDGHGPAGTVRYYIHVNNLATYMPAPDLPQEGVTPCHPPTDEVGDKTAEGGDISDTDGVTSAPERGDTMSPEPSFNQELKPSVKTDLGDKLSPPMQKAWNYVLNQLNLGASQGVRDKYIASLDLDTRSTVTEWLIRCTDPTGCNNRLGKTIERLVAGLFDNPPQVFFINNHEHF